MNKEKAEKLFIEIAEQYEEYNHIIKNWDNLLAEHNL